MDKDREARERREAAADEVAELALSAVKAFLTGQARIVVTKDVVTGTARINFEMPKT